MDDNNQNDKWFCSECTALLGIRQENEMIIRFKQEINLTICGKIIFVCRRCGTINQIDTQTK